MSVLGRVIPSRSDDGDVDRSADRPRLTFVVPVYDPPPDVLRELLASIDAQTHAGWECIVVDDASTDASVRDLLDRWASRDPRHRLHRRAGNGGIAAATNDGIDRADGDAIAFVDHDDLVHADAASDVIGHFAAHPDDAVVYTDEWLIDGAGNTLADYHKPDYSPIRHLGQHYLAHLVAARRDAIGDLRVRSAFEPAQDVDFWLRVIERATTDGHRVGHIARPRYAWRALAGSSALAADEKSGMTDAVRRSMTAALERRNVDATATTVIFDGAETTSVFITPAATSSQTASVSVLAVGAATTGSDLAQHCANTDADIIVLDPPGAPTDWWQEIADLLTLPDVAATGPTLIDEHDRIVSVGRTIDPLLRDTLAGTHDGPGPWGALFVHREVSAIAPWGAVFDRAAVAAVGGFSPGFGADVAVADVCVRLREAQRSIICSPAARLAVEPELGAPTPERDDDWAVLVRRRPDIDWSERFDPTGLAPLGARRPSAWAEARAMIVAGDVDLVTTDVFDTLVTRPASRPSDLFVTLGRRLAEAGLTTGPPAAFAIARRHAEAAARRLAARDDGTNGIVRAPEVGLAEIWTRLGPVVGVDPAIGTSVELDVEAEHLRPIPELVEVLRTARRLGCRVVAVSDIYLSTEQLGDVLHRCGVADDLLDEIVTSTDAGFGKADGLLARVIAGEDVDPSRVLHLGDNEIADVDTATALGAQAAHVEVPRRHRHIVRPGAAVAAYSAATGTDGGLDAAVRSTLVEAGSLGSDPGYQFGVVAAGPAITGFVHWAATTTAELGAAHLHCLLREGGEIARLADTVAPGVATARLVHASRWVMLRAACIDATPDQLFTALARRGPTTATHVEAAFGCPADTVADIWGAESVTQAHLDVACARLARDENLRTQIIESAATLRDRVAALLARELADDDRIVLCDVGWGGTIQAGIERILRATGDDRPVTGLYLALSKPGEERVSTGADMRSYLPNSHTDTAAAEHSRVVSHHADSVERILTPQLGTLVDVDADGSPITATKPEYHPPSLHAARAGVRDVARHLVSGGLDHDTIVDPAMRAALATDLAAVIGRPSPDLARTLLGWQHDDVAGTDLRSLAGGLEPDIASAMTIDNADLFDTDSGTWIEGVAAVHHPAFGLQLAAQRSDGSATHLVSRDGLGSALLAAFPVGSELAELQIRRDPGLGARGQLALRLAGAVPSLRVVRFDAADGHVVVRVERLELTMTLDDGTRTTVDVRDHLHGPGIRRIGPDRIAQRAGGHLAYSPDRAIAPRVRHLDVVVVFRRWPVPADDPAVRTAPLADVVARLRRRIT